MGLGIAALVWLLGETVRPPECASLEDPKNAVVWQRIKAPEQRKYCDLIASGLAKLASEPGMPEAALESAVLAEKILPGRSPAAVLSGRALLRLDRSGEAYAALREAQRRSERALDEPYAMLSWARAAARTGHTDESRSAYLALLPSADSLSSAERSNAYQEAGFLLMAGGPKRLTESIETLRQARRESSGDGQLVAVVGLALALDRAGEHAEARSLLAERPLAGLDDAVERARRQRVVGPQTTDAEAYALIAMADEVRQPKAARDAWHRYLEAMPSGPWSGHARDHETALSRGGSVASVKKPGASGASGSDGAPKGGKP